MKNKNTVKPDSVLKDFWRNNSRFADLFNQVFFHGEPFIKPERLTDKDTDESAVILEKNKTVTSISRARDLIKQYDNGIDLVLVGIENQMNIHYAMPVRSMLYEALDYTKQCKELEQSHRKNKDFSNSDEFLSGMCLNDKLKPTITLVIYYGEKPWDGPISLSDMMKIPPNFQPLFTNYNLHLLQVCSINHYQFKNYDNQDFFTLISEFYHNKGNMDINSFKKKYSDLDVYWETMAALGAATGSTDLMEYALKKEGGKIHMCTALENLKQEGIQEGFKVGIQEGLKEGIQEGLKEGIQEGLKEGIQEGLKRGTIKGMVEAYQELDFSEEIILSKIMNKFNLTNEEALEYLSEE